MSKVRKEFTDHILEVLRQNNSVQFSNEDTEIIKGFLNDEIELDELIERLINEED